MFRFRYSGVFLVLLTIIVATTAMAAVQNISYSGSEDNPLVRDAKVYASALEVDLDTAIRRLMLQDLADGLGAELAEKEVDTFAGLWIQHIPQFRIIVQFTQDGKETIRPYIENKTLADIVSAGSKNTIP